MKEDSEDEGTRRKRRTRPFVSMNGPPEWENRPPPLSLSLSLSCDIPARLLRDPGDRIG